MQDNQEKEPSTDTVQGTREYKKKTKSRSVHVRFEVDKLALGQVSLTAGLLRVSPANIILPILHIQSSSPCRHYQKEKWSKPVNLPESREN